MIEKIWEILTTLTEETQKAALDKCTELGFDIKRGVVSLDESFINLTNSKNILSDAIQNRKLIQLPISVQKILFTNLEAISRSLTSLINGTDEVVNLSNYIEQLNVAIWQYGFHNLSDEVLGYLEKINQLKQQEVELANLRREIQTALKQKKALEKLLAEANSSVESMKTIVAQSEENSKRTAESFSATVKAFEKASAFLTEIQQNDTTSSQLLASTKTSNSEVIAIEPKIKEFYSLVDQYRTKMNTTSEDAQNIVSANKTATEDLIKKLSDLEDQIKVQIQKATGYSLFHSFQTRQYEIANSKNIWLYALAFLVVASLGVSVYVIHSTTVFDVAFYIKLSMSLPLIYAIAFCTVQYGRERKFEEEYAFKSNISISLMPYKELVEKLVDENQPGEREKFTAFIIDAITRVYTSPTDKVFEIEQKNKNTDKEPLKNLEKVLKAVVDPLKPLLEAIKHV